MSEFREYYKKIPVDIRQSFGSTSKTAEYVYNEQQVIINKLKSAIQHFIDRVEGGTARSTLTYKMYKDLLAELAQNKE